MVDRFSILQAYIASIDNLYVPFAKIILSEACFL